MSVVPIAGTTVGLRPLGRQMLRLDRVRILAWSVSMAVLTLAVANAWSTLYPEAQSRVEFANALQSSPALTDLLGPLYNPVSTGGLTAWRLGSALVFVLGLVNAFIVVRHTRTEEDAGRADLVRSGAVGRVSPLLVAFGAAAAIDLVFAGGVIGSLGAFGEPVAGAVAFALTVAGGALVFAAIASVAAQAMGSSRAANALSSLIVTIMFIAYAVGNTTPDTGWLAALTPFGWASRARPFAGENWWLVAVPYVVAGAVLAVGIALGVRRDLGSSLVRTRRGRRHAPPWLRTSFALAWRVDRAQLATWVVATFVFGVFVGYLAQTANDLLRSNPQLGRFLERLGGGSAVSDSYVLVMIGVLSFGSAAYAVAMMLRTNADEESGRLELLLTTAVPRERLLTGRALIVVAGVVAIQASAGIGIGLSNGLANQNLGPLMARYVSVALVGVPASLTLAAGAVFVVGALPRMAWVAWAAFGYCVAVGELGAILGLPEWTQRTTPFWFTPRWPVEDLNPLPVLVLTALALAVSSIGVVRFGSRDVPGT